MIMASFTQPHDILLFGDQSVEKLPAIRSLYKYASTSKLLRKFLQAAIDVLQTETGHLDPHEKHWFQDAESIEALAEANATTETPSEVVATVLMGIARLGELLLYAEEDPSILGSASRPSDVLAFCTGEVPAAVALVAQDTSQLYALAVEAVGILCRFALAIIRRSEAIDTTQECWATTLVGVPKAEVEQMLQNFFDAERIPVSRRVCISVEGKGWLTVFGPPSTLHKLWASVPRLSDCAKIPTDAKGAVHMNNLPGLAIGDILGTSPLLESPVDNRKARMLSPFTLLPYEGTTLRSILEAIIPDITQNAYFPEATTATVVQSLRDASFQGTIRLTTLGHTHYLPLVQKALEDGKVNCNLSAHKSPKHDTSNTRSGSGFIAVVGMSGRFPGAHNVQEFWDNLLRGHVEIKEIPKSRFDLEQFHDPTHSKKNSTAAKHGSFLDRPGAFDYRLFNMSPREAAQTDPLQRLYLTIAHEALEMSGYSPDATPSTVRNRIATYFGQCSDDWRDIVPNSESGTDVYWTPGTVRAFAPSRLNYHFKFGGGSYSVDNACASSTTCVSLACSALLDRECDMAMAGGGSILASPHPFAALSRAGMVSLTGGCRTFHDDADGYCRGEGIGCVVLKRLEDAKTENDNILGVIRGSARNYSNTATSMTHPSSESQQRLYSTVLQRAHIRPEEVSYVEMHGTGTQAGDAVEVSSVLEVFADKRAKDSPLIVGAVKANIGHGEAAAGICSLIKTLQMLRTGRVPPQPGMPFKVNHRFPDMAKRNVYIASKGAGLRASKRSSNGKKKIIVNSFDASGGNTCLAIEEAPRPETKTDDPRTCHTVVVSAKTTSSLANNKSKLLGFLKRNNAAKLSDVAYSTTARRMQHALRSSYVASTTKELIQALESDLKPSDENADAAISKKVSQANMVFAFTGQGSQYVGMGRTLFQSHPVFRRLLEGYQTMLAAQGLPADKSSFLELIARDDLDLAAQSATKVQLAVAALEIALAAVWRSWGITPDLVIGHSLGEYAALCVAGVLTVSDALYLVAKRGIMMEEKLTAGTYAMLVIRQDAERVRQQLSHLNTPSCLVALKNAPEMTVVSGTQNDIQTLRAHLQSQGAKTTLLQLPYGFHSAQLDPILDDFESAAAGVTFSKPTIPVASSLLAKVFRETGVFSPKYLRDQARQAVDYIGALNSAQVEGLIHEKTMFLEIGPQPICSSFIASTLQVNTTRLLAGLRNGEDVWRTTSTALSAAYNAGLPVNWTEYHKQFIKSLTLLELPTYAFEETEFWTPFKWQEAAVVKSATTRSEVEPSGKSLHGLLQRLISCDAGPEAVSMSFECDTSQPDLREAIMGHLVGGTPLMPVTFWCEMATTAAQHAYGELTQTTQAPAMELRNVLLSSSAAFQMQGSYPTIVIHARLEKRSQVCKIAFESRLRGMSKKHGNCEVAFIPQTSLDASAPLRFLPLIKSRVKSLEGGPNNPNVHRLLKPVVYRLFQHLVTYGERYQAIEELMLDVEARDAVAKITLNEFNGPVNLLSAYWKDSIAHVAAVVLNCGLLFPEDKALITSGFESWHTFEELRSNIQYTSYVAFQDTDEDSTIVGDIYVLEHGRIVATVNGLKFHMLKKEALRASLSPVSAPAQPTAARPDVSKALVVNVGASEPLPAVLDSVGEVKIMSVKEDSESVPLPTNTSQMDISSAFMEAVAAETGLSLSELQPTTEFGDIGVDSLMSITVLASLKQKTGVELMGTFFGNHETIGSATQALREMFPTKPQAAPKRTERPAMSHTPSFTAWPSTPASELSNAAPTITPAPASTGISTPRSEGSDPWVSVTPLSDLSLPPSPPSVKSLPIKQSSQEPGCKVVRIQGKSSNEDIPLFLFADETGTISTYIQLPQLESRLNVFGVESPFVKDPSQLQSSIEELAKMSLDAVLKQRPSGPYKLGGFSGGGVVAYEVAKLLEAAGEQVDIVCLIDTPMLESNSQTKTVSKEELQDIGVINGHKRSGKFQSTVLPAHQEHITKFFEALSSYQVDGELPATLATMVTARHGLRSGSPANGLSSAWSAGNANRWAELFKDVQVHELDADHHGLMSHPKVKDLSAVLSKVLK